MQFEIPLSVLAFAEESLISSQMSYAIDKHTRFQMISSAHCSFIYRKLLNTDRHLKNAAEQKFTSWQTIRRSGSKQSKKRERSRQTNRNQERKKKMKSDANCIIALHSTHRLVAASSEWMQFVYLQKRCHHVTCGNRRDENRFFVFMFRKMRNKIEGEMQKMDVWCQSVSGEWERTTNGCIASMWHINSNGAFSFMPSQWPFSFRSMCQSHPFFGLCLEYDKGVCSQHL